jgi:hypothetical protein
MEVRFHSDKEIPSTPAFGDDIRETLTRVFKRFVRRVTMVEVHLADENGAKSGAHDKRCRLEARLASRRPVSVSHHAATIQLAFRGAAMKLKALLGSDLGKRGMR